MEYSHEIIVFIDAKESMEYFKRIQKSDFLINALLYSVDIFENHTKIKATSNFSGGFIDEISGLFGKADYFCFYSEEDSPIRLEFQCICSSSLYTFGWPFTFKEKNIYSIIGLVISDDFSEKVKYSDVVHSCPIYSYESPSLSKDRRNAKLFIKEDSWLNE